jgi:hypothetical protein
LVGQGQTVIIDDRITNGPGLGTLKDRTDKGTQCLIHADSAGLAQGQDIFPAPPVAAGSPILIQPGANNPDVPLRVASHVSRSDSVVTVPLFDGRNLCSDLDSPCTGTAPIVGFLQLGIIQNVAPAGLGQVQVIILNASGCTPGSTGPAVSGGDMSPIPVRLIQGN